MRQKILIVDDEKAIRDMVATHLTQYQVLQAADGEAALEILSQESVDLCVVDVMMPGMDGFALCDEIKRYYELPVIMLTARTALTDKRTAYERGTDDYLTKPFNTEELDFRIAAVLRRYSESEAQVELGNVVIDANTFETHINNKTLYLPKKEFDLLKYLVQIAPNAATRDELIEHIWGFDFVGDERTVDVHIKRLRKRLADNQADIEIMTLRGVGYKVQHV